MMRSLLPVGLLMAGLSLAACSPAPPTTKPEAPKVEEPTAPPNAAAADEDLFILQIDIGRVAVFVDRAHTAADINIPYALKSSVDEDPSAPPNLWRDLREVGRDVVIVKEIYCAKGLVKGAPCKQAPPAFLSADPDPTPDKAGLQKHLEELQTYFEPFLTKACTLGRARTKDEMYCSVE
jgi:hypothetical protein